MVKKIVRGSIKIGGIEMNSNILLGIMIPFIGTTLGSAMVFFYEKGNECPPAENASRICVGSNDRGVGLVASYSGH